MKKIILAATAAGLVAGIIGGYAVNEVRQQNYASPSAVRTVASEEQQVIEAVKKASGAVVSIVATQDLQVIERGYSDLYEDFCADPFFRNFFGDRCDVPSEQPKRRTQRRQVSAGTGFIVTSDGLIITNKHVVDVPEGSYTVITSTGKKYPATVVARDPQRDLAIIRIQASSLPVLPMADSDARIGQTVIAIGNSLGQFAGSVSKGIVSGLSRSIVASSGVGSSERLDQLIQTDAAINHGNSGGPLLNLDGEAIGVNVAIAEGAQNVGFAIPISLVRRDLDSVARSGSISYPSLGVRYVMIDEGIREEKNLPVNQGALLIAGQGKDEPAVIPNTGASRAGLREGDIILEVDGKAIDDENTLTTAIQSRKIGDVISLKILREGNPLQLKATLGELK